MSHPLVVNRYKQKGDIYGGRGIGSILGNPYSNVDGTLAKYKTDSREESIEKHKLYFIDKYNNDINFRKYIKSLKGKKLECTCAPKDCHLNIVAEYANN